MSPSLYLISLSLTLYKYEFIPKIGPMLACIGLVQPATGEILSMSERPNTVAGYGPQEKSHYAIQRLNE